MKFANKSILALPLVLLVPCTLQAAQATGQLEVGQTSPAMGETMQAAGACGAAGESVNFKLKQKGKTHKLDTTVKTKGKEGKFGTGVELAPAMVEKGPATLVATCSGGKKLSVDFNIGVTTSTAGSKLSQAADSVEEHGQVDANKNNPSTRNGVTGGKLKLNNDKPLQADSKVSVTGDCPNEDGEVRFSFQQNKKTEKFEDLSLVVRGHFNDELELSNVQAQPGPAELSATCPGGKLLNTKINIGK